MNTDNTESRRKFLKTAGKFAVYTPPALLVMSKTSSANFAASAGNDAGTTTDSTGGSGNSGSSQQESVQSLLDRFF